MNKRIKKKYKKCFYVNAGKHKITRDDLDGWKPFPYSELVHIEAETIQREKSVRRQYPNKGIVGVPTKYRWRRLASLERSCSKTQNKGAQHE